MTDATALTAWAILALGVPALVITALGAPRRAFAMRLQQRLRQLSLPLTAQDATSLDRNAASGWRSWGSLRFIGGVGLMAATIGLGAWWGGAGATASLALGLVVVVGVKGALAFRRQRRLHALREQWPEAVDQIARALRAGHALPAALLMVSQECAEPLSSEFRQLHEQMQIGVGWDEAMRQLAQRVPLPEVRFLTMAVILQRSTGGQLAEVLSAMAELVRERLRLADKMRVLSAEGRLSAWVLGALPLLVGVVLHAVNPGFVSVLWTDPTGLTLLRFCAVLYLVGVIWIARLIRLPQ